MSHIPRGWGSVARCVLVALACSAFVATPANAQSEHDGPPPRPMLPVWRLVVDGETEHWDDVSTWPFDSLHAATQHALAQVQRAGYYQAQVDSVVVREASEPPTVEVFIRRGPRIRIGRLELHDTSALSADELHELMRTHEGGVLDRRQLEADIEALLARYEAEGYPVAQIRVAQIDLRSGPPPSLHVVLEIDEGPALWLKRVAVAGAERTTSHFVTNAAQLDVGAPLTEYDPDAIQQRLRDTGLFREVGVPELHVEADGGAVLQVPLVEEAPGTFDVAFGYLPPASNARSAQVVGSGHLRLANLFGGGRTAGLQIDRRPGRVSTADVRLADPYVLGWPLRLEGRFSGEQRDSTYSKQSYHAGIGYLLGPGTEVFGTVTREITQPGQGGVRLRAGKQLIPRATSWFTGLGLRVRNVDRVNNPRRGFWVETTLERGRKRRRFRALTAEGDTTRRQEQAGQERLQLSSRAFVPLLAHQVLALGVDARLLRSGAYDRSELFRMGGANTLRGYDEDRFQGNAVGRFVLEYRYQIDRVAFAYLFGDLGYVATPALSERPAKRGVHPGYGLGLQFGTEIGLVKASYALNPEDGSPANGRIHLGLSFGL